MSPKTITRLRQEEKSFASFVVFIEFLLPLVFLKITSQPAHISLSVMEPYFSNKIFTSIKIKKFTFQQINTAHKQKSGKKQCMDKNIA